jgi:hypothetical protein
MTKEEREALEEDSIQVRLAARVLERRYPPPGPGSELYRTIAHLRYRSKILWQEAHNG